MDSIEFAKSLFGNQSTQKPNSTSYTSSQSNQRITGECFSDSADGYVEVYLDGEVCIMPTTVDCREGDTLEITLANTHPTVTGAIGGGDRTRSSITAIANYFWHDTAGAHVSTQEYSTEGRNLLATSSGLYICTGSTVESSFTDSFAQIGRDNQSHLTIESKKLAFLTGSETDGAAFKVETERETLGGKEYDNATISASTENGADFSQLFVESGETASIYLLASETHGTSDTDANITIQAKSAHDATTAKDTSLSVIDEAITITHNDGSWFNTATVPMIFMGTKYVSASGSSGRVWTKAGYAAEFGHDFDPWTDHISFMNPNGHAAHIQDCTVASNGDIYATFDRTVSGTIVVGYCVMTTTY